MYRFYWLVIKFIDILNRKGMRFTVLKTIFYLDNKVRLWIINKTPAKLFDNYLTLPDLSLSKLVKFKISVIIPNYNYAKYLPQRIYSIINQTVTPFEIIFLDDCSTDNSVAIAQELLQKSGINHKIIVNQSNQGVYSQWVKGINQARGDYIWIAEADDFCSKDILAELLGNAVSSNADLAYCQSIIIDDNDRITHPNVLALTNDFSFSKWRKRFCSDGKEMVEKYWFHKNLIVNASSCIFRKEALAQVDLNLLLKFRYCGDWFFYVSLVKSGKVCYTNKVLNVYRKHQQGVTQSYCNSNNYFAEILQIKQFMLENYHISPAALAVDKTYLKSYVGFNEQELDMLYSKYLQLDGQ